MAFVNNWIISCNIIRKKNQLCNNFPVFYGKNYKTSIKYKICMKNSTNNMCKHTLKKNFFLSSIAFYLIFNSINVNAIPLEKPSEKIIDESGTLTKSSISYIEKTINKIKETNQSNIYFVSIRNLPFEKNASGYAEELFKKWELGSNDVLVILVNKIAKAGIFYGNQVNSLSESIVKSIGEETYYYKAKDEEYSSAALDVTNRLFAILSNKGDPGPPQLNRESNNSNFKTAKNTEEQRSKYVAIIVILLIIAFVVPMVQFFFYVKDE
jgi:uncharacterized membrane protein YgcG